MALMQALFAMGIMASNAQMYKLSQCASSECSGMRGSVLLQAGKRQGTHQVSLEEQELVEHANNRSRADDARFLIMASFGPTRGTLNALEKTNFSKWIRDQMALPVESHREYYRSRVNPSFDAETQAQGFFKSRLPCAEGSRWHRYAISQADREKAIWVGNGSVYIDGGFRTDILQGSLASRWSGLASYSGYVCYVEEHVGGDVHLSTHPSCWNDKMVMPNPAIHLADSSMAVATSLPFKHMRPSTLLLESPCHDPDEFKPNNTKDSFIIQTNGDFYAYDSRVELVENSLSSPSRDICPDVTFLNEPDCRVPQPALLTATAEVQGLLVELYTNHRSSDFASETASRPTMAFILEQDINYASSSSALHHQFPRYYFAVQMKGSINIQQAGEYEFFVSSDDGSRLLVDGVEVIDNGGSHSMAEKSGKVSLAAGKHPLLIEYFQGSGSAGFIFSWVGPDSGNAKSVVPISALSTLPPQWSSGCFLPCGSTGEVANDPSLGHVFTMYTPENANRNFDNRYNDRMGASLTKSTVWTAKALHAKDQLRQRMAWALSQIFVVSSQGFGNNDRTEMWLNYYDTFVRNAFGNFRDVLKQVTFNPLMGSYLTNTGSSSYDYNKKFPNENYAREIMQLFTIGLEQLHMNGSIQKDAHGKDIPTYGMDHITNFARVFTGFQEQERRGNIELSARRRRGSNWIDPLRMNWEKHDVHPKPDLEGNFLGDGYPLCDESLPELFLAKGSRFEFLTYYYTGPVLELAQGSALYDLLCDRSSDGQCNYPAVAELQETLSCAGTECDKANVKVVKVDGLYYSHSPPTCVHHYFQAWKGKQTSTFYMVTDKNSLCTKGSEIDDPTLADDVTLEMHENQHCGGGSLSGNWSLTGESTEYKSSAYTDVETCKATCMAHPECAGFVRRDSDQICSMWKRGSLSRYSKSGHQCYEKIHRGCEEAVHAIFGGHSGKPWYGSSKWYPKGCSHSNGRMYFNIHSEGRTRSGFEPVCKAHIVVQDNGNVGASWTEHNSFAVPWNGAAAAAGLHFVSIQEKAAFARLPNRQELEAAHLKYGAYQPRGVCLNCDAADEVKAYSVNGASTISAETVFELDGKFYLNLHRSISAANGQFAFRSPPVFLRGQTGKTAEQAALAEVDSLLDHLFYHPNTPVFIGRRLIQRFGNSNPSCSYIESVSAAFRTGKLGNNVYSGKYGDLGATVAAILLHDDAKMEGSLGLQGSLREPILKMVHLMRSMEYQDSANEHAVFAQLQDVIGQFPFQSPTVFNFYLADFGFPQEADAMMAQSAASGDDLTGSMPGPEPEPEPEPLVSPELQIFTPPHFVGFLNGVSSLIKTGVSYRCDGGESLGIRSNHYDGLTFRETCPQGQLKFQAASDERQTLDELDVLLTGGRLTPSARDMVEAAFEDAAPHEKLQRAQQAILLTPEFHTLGAPLPKQQPRPDKAEPIPTEQRPYKAAVILFLAGGADTWNMLVPLPESCKPLYEEYKAIRTDLALEPDDCIQISVAGQSCDSFGIHGQFGFLKKLYDEKDALFFTNIGSLVTPMTKQQYRSNEAQRCAGLFSHSDQQTAAQTLQCQTAGNSPRGAGGRIADALASEGFQVASFSLAGSAIFAQGLETNRQIVSENGNKRFHEYEMWRDAIANITKQQHTHIFSEQYTKTLLETVELTEDLGRAFENVKLFTEYEANSGLQKQLQQVAKLMTVRNVRKAERDVFFVQIGGWDMHSNMVDGLRSKFASINDALKGFVAEMKAQGIWDSVILATTSEFARTLDSNGGGSDHAWAGQQFMIGGALDGGRVLNKYPSSFKKDGYNDLGRGRLIPEFPWESMMLPIADWMGVDMTNAETRSMVFPNLINFNATHVNGAESVFIPAAM